VAQVIDLVNTALGRVVTWLVLVMTLIGAYNAVMRTLDKQLGTQLSSNTYLELQWYLFSIVFLYGAAYTLKEDGHVRVDVLFSRFSERTRAWIDLLGTLLFLIPFSFILLYVALPWVANAVRIMEMSPDPGGLPRWPIKLALPIAFGILILQGVSQAIKSAAFLRGLTAERGSSAPRGSHV
jgi:TRAP-type mannitol/chloroaromatic compound transport system permease small subunit